jgi:hypothetical protein
MKRLVALAVAALLFALVSCKKEMAVEESRAAAPAGPAAGAPADQPKAAPAGAPVANRAPAIPRKLVRTVDLELEVKSPEETAARVQALVAGLGGYVASAATQRRNDLLEYTLALRVPVERFEEAVKAVRAMGVRVDRESQKVEDVTDQYIDLDARMRTLEATEGELRGLLAESRQRGRKVAEIMEIYRQLVEIRSQIEQIHAQLNSFDKLAALDPQSGSGPYRGGQAGNRRCLAPDRHHPLELPSPGGVPQGTDGFPDLGPDRPGAHRPGSRRPGVGRGAGRPAAAQPQSPFCSSSARWIGLRPVVWAICWRQLKPSATIRVSAAASRTAGSSTRSPMASEIS